MDKLFITVGHFLPYGRYMVVVKNRFGSDRALYGLRVVDGGRAIGIV